MIFPWLERFFDILAGPAAHAHHALLLHGPRGIGKTRLGVSLAQAWLCTSRDAHGRACGLCPACRWVADEHHPDLRILRPEAGDSEAPGEKSAKKPIDEPADRSAEKAPAGRGRKASTEIRIDQVRALEPFVGMSAHRSGCKVVVIDPADAMNIPAANALLKTLEEPTGDTRFVLVATHAERLPATVRSRCLSLALPLPDFGQALDWLVTATGSEREQAARWLAASGGAPLRARELADPAAASAHRTLVETFAALPNTSVTAAADRLAGVKATLWSTVLLAWIVDLQRCQAGARPRFFPDQMTVLQAQAQRATLTSLSLLARDVAAAARYADRSLNPRLMIEDALIQVCSALQPGPSQSRRRGEHRG